MRRFKVFLITFLCTSFVFTSILWLSVFPEKILYREAEENADNIPIESINADDKSAILFSIEDLKIIFFVKADAVNNSIDFYYISDKYSPKNDKSVADIYDSFGVVGLKNALSEDLKCDYEIHYVSCSLSEFEEIFANIDEIRLESIHAEVPKSIKKWLLPSAECVDLESFLNAVSMSGISDGEEEFLGECGKCFILQNEGEILSNFAQGTLELYADIKTDLNKKEIEKITRIQRLLNRGDVLVNLKVLK